MKNMNIELGRKIKALRTERDMTQKSLAEILNVSPQAGVSDP
jgi:DNA-binding XRE family transcriptional regulator